MLFRAQADATRRRNFAARQDANDGACFSVEEWRAD